MREIRGIQHHELYLDIDLEEVLKKIVPVIIPKVIPVAVTTRSVGMVVARSYNKASILKIPEPVSIYSMFRINIAVLESLMVDIATAQICIHPYSQDMQLFDMCCDFRNVTRTFLQTYKPLDNLLQVVSIITTQNTKYMPIGAKDVTSAGKFIPRAENVWFSNLRSVVDAMASAETPLEARRLFILNNPLPGAVYENYLLTNGEEILPSGYDLSVLQTEIAQANAYMDKVRKKSSKLISGPISISTSGDPAMLVSSSMNDELRVPPRAQGQHLPLANDKQERERSDARNALEEYVYDLRGKLSSEDELGPFVVAGDRDKYIQQLDNMESWLYEEGEDCTRQIYVDKLSDLKIFGEPIKNRKMEFETRTAALEELAHCIQLSQKFIGQYKAGDEKYNHLEPGELAKVEEAVCSAAKWLEEKRATLSSCHKTQDPPVTTAQIRGEKKNLTSCVTPVMNKPKPKVEAPPEPTAENASHQDSQESSKTNDQQQDQGKQDNMDVDN